jgi:hypothetical protein
MMVVVEEGRERERERERGGDETRCGVGRKGRREDKALENIWGGGGGGVTKLVVKWGGGVTTRRAEGKQ